MIIEGRTITTIEEMREFCDAAVAVTHADPAAIRLRFRLDDSFQYASKIDGLLRTPEVSRDLETKLPTIESDEE